MFSSMNNSCLALVFMLILFRAARSSDEKKQVLTENAKLFDLTLVTTVSDVENQFYCIDVDKHKTLKFEWTCERITTIYLTKNMHIDCKENHLPIFFYVFTPVVSVPAAGGAADTITYLRDVVSGFLTNQSGLIGKMQSKSEKCNIFKRYFFLTFSYFNL